MSESEDLAYFDERRYKVVLEPEFYVWCGETDFPVRQEIKTTILEWASSGQPSDCSSLFPFYLLCPLVDIVPRFHFVVSISVKEPVIFYRPREGGRGEGWFSVIFF